MSDRSIPSGQILAGTPRRARLDRFATRLMLARLEQLGSGAVIVREGAEERMFGDVSAPAELTARITIHDPRFFSDVAFGGAIGAAEAYIRGYWDCDDLTALVRILVRNRDVLERLNGGTAILTRPLQKLFHWLNQNTRKGSRRNIGAHYDLGNDFFSLWLDTTMMYSSAIFTDPETPLEEASIEKLDRVCRWLELDASDDVIEIGTGWGGFAIHAAGKYGCHVTTTTISREQYALAKQRIADAGLSDRITVLMDDYRDLSGQFDKLVSIEMIEAVGHEFHDSFFRKCGELLRPAGRMFLQAITIADQRYEHYRRSVDFINRYIFPGGCLTSLSSMSATLASETDMRISRMVDIGPHYATTLRHWRDRFLARLDRIRELGYSEEFIRLWQYYLCYCEGAFIERAIGDVQMLIEKPLSRSFINAA